MAQPMYTLLDIRGLALRSIYGGKDPGSTLDSEGKKVNTAAYGLSQFIERYFLPALELAPPRSVIAVWDGGNEYRKGLFPFYKKNRHARERTEEIDQQLTTLMSAVRRLLNYTGCTSCVVPGVEADDLISFLDNHLPGYHSVWTVDQDLAQLESETTDVVYMGEFLKGSDIAIDPAYVALEKSLVGDGSDEYPGVRGFGEGKYNAILNEFGMDSRDDLLSAVQNKDYTAVKEAEGVAQETQSKSGLQLILKDTSMWELCYELALLHPELCEGRWGNKLARIEWTKRLTNAQFVYSTLQEFNCVEHYAKLQEHMPTQTLITTENWDDFADDFNDQAKLTPFFAFDYESTDVLQHKPFQTAKKSPGDYVDVLSQSITGMSITYGENLQHTVYLSTGHKDTQNIDDLLLLDILKMVQEDEGKELVAHNAPFEIALTDTNLLHRLDPVACTRIMAQNVDENDLSGLKVLTKRYLGYQQTTYKEVLESAGVERMDELTGSQVLAYGCDDSVCAASLYDLFTIIAHCEGTHTFLPYEYTANLVLYDNFESGLRIDWERLSEMKAEDAATYADNMESLRSLLAANCPEDPERAAELFSELSEYLKARLISQVRSEDEIFKQVTNLKAKLEASTRYIPLTDVTVDVKFVPTPLQITKVAKRLGIQTELTGITASKVTEFCVLAGEEVQEDAKAVATQKAFVDALVAAQPQLKRREGEQYDAFFSFCVNILSDGAPVNREGDELNLDSSPQMQQLLYCKLGLPIRLRTKVKRGSTRQQLGYKLGSPATDDDAIASALAEDAPEGSWRRDALMALRKAKSAFTRAKNYWRPYPLWKHPRDEAVHGWISNCGTVTRRFTGRDPNELQLSGRGEVPVRSMILPRREGHVILSPDWNGQELRILASLSLDPVMVDAYTGKEKKDVHSITASSISHIILRRESPGLLGSIVWEDKGQLKVMDYSKFLELLKGEDPEVSKLFKGIRYSGKQVLFGIIYGGGPPTLSRSLLVPVDIAELFLTATLATYTRLEPWQKESVEFARVHGYVQSSYGNRRHIGEGIVSDDFGIRSRLERQAINAQIQMTGSDMMKVVCTEIEGRKVLQRANGVGLIFPYDELAVSVPRSAAWDVWCEMQEIMTLTPPGHIVPQLPELKASALDWGTCAELGANPTEDELNALFDQQLRKQSAA